jgi:hypothetical protein
MIQTLKQPSFYISALKLAAILLCCVDLNRAYLGGMIPGVLVRSDLSVQAAQVRMVVLNACTRCLMHCNCHYGALTAIRG